MFISKLKKKIIVKLTVKRSYTLYLPMPKKQNLFSLLFVAKSLADPLQSLVEVEIFSVPLHQASANQQLFELASHNTEHWNSLWGCSPQEEERSCQVQ